MTIIKSLVFFLLAGLCEIGGGYLVWLWLKNGKPVWYGIAGLIILAAYGIAATFQTAGFGRVYATYGGVFVIMSILWAWKIDHAKPDKYDAIGAAIVLLGVSVIYFAPRKA